MHLLQIVRKALAGSVPAGPTDVLSRARELKASATLGPGPTGGILLRVVLPGLA